MKIAHSYPFVLPLLFIFAFLSRSSGQSNANLVLNDTPESLQRSKVDKLDELLNAYVEYGKFNGTVLVAHGGKVIYENAFGFANMEWDIPNQTDTKFRIASISKQFTAMLIMQLAAEEKLKLDVPISAYLPEFPKRHGDSITIHQLLTHSSGIQNYTSFSNYREMMRKPMKPEEIIHAFADSSLQFKPGERFDYSNSGYALLGAIIENISGKPYGVLLKERIFEPLNMKNSGLDHPGTILKNRATGYNKDGLNYRNASYIDMSVAYAAGGIYSTVEDLFLWDQALYTDQLIPEKYKSLIFKKHIPAWNQDYGYGWFIGEMSIGNTKEKIKKIEHDGFINGFNTLILRLPDDQSTIILLNNTGGSQLYTMSYAITGILYDKPYHFPKKSVAYSFLEVIEKEDFDQGKSFYEKIKNDPAYHLDENEMNMVAYKLLQSDRAEQAIDVLKLALAAFPNAFNLYDSYGEALLALGQNEQAITQYTKSVRLNPKNENGIKMLNSLGVDISEDDLFLLKSDKSWSKEIFTFPLNFAPDLKLEGTEEAHFSPGWRNQESPGFWSYSFVWKIDQETQFSLIELEEALALYFDGLMNVVNKVKDREIPKSKIDLKKKGSNKKSQQFTGTVDIFDTFTTQDILQLQVTAEQYYCKKEQQTIVHFRFSPQAFGQETWTILNDIKIQNDICAE